MIDVPDAEVAAAVIDDLIPPAFDVLYPSIGGRLDIAQARGIVSRTLVEHLNLIVADRAKVRLPKVAESRGLAAGRAPMRDAEIGMSEMADGLEVRTFDRYSSQYGTRAQLLERLTARMSDNGLAANLSLTLIEIRTDLMLAASPQVHLLGVGSLSCAGESVSKLSDSHSSAVGTRDGDVPRLSGGRSRRWYLRAVVDQVLLGTVCRPVSPYLLRIPPLQSMSRKSNVGDKSSLPIDTLSYERLVRRQ